MKRHCIATFFSIAAIVVPAGAAIAADECCPNSAPGPASALASAGSMYQQPAPVSKPIQTVDMPGNKFPLPMADSSGQRGEAGQGRTGKLAIKAVQGTPDGPAIIDAPVEVQLYHRGMMIETINTKLDEYGIVMIEDLPLAMDIQPVVLISHADLTYQKVGAIMDRANPEQTVEVTCYELTDEQPLWKIRMRHVMLSPAPDGSDGLHVTEVMMVENLGDRTWAGSVRAGLERPVTTAFTLPDGAMGVSLGRGFHDWCCTTLDEQPGRTNSTRHALLNHLPIMPGATEMIFSYILPTRRGAATIDITAPNAPGGVDQVMVLVPDNLQATSVVGLEVGGSDRMGQMPVTRYMAAGVSPGETMSLTLTGLSSSADSALATASFAKTVAAIGVIVVVIGALWLIFSRPVKKHPKAMETQREAAPSNAFIGDSI